MNSEQTEQWPRAESYIEESRIEDELDSKKWVGY